MPRIFEKPGSVVCLKGRPRVGVPSRKRRNFSPRFDITMEDLALAGNAFVINKLHIYLAWVGIAMSTRYLKFPPSTHKNPDVQLTFLLHL